MTARPIAGRYEVLAPLGEGTMGQVLRAHDGVRGHAVALKVVSPRLADGGRAILQFKQEFRLMAHVRHAHCCQVYDFGQAEDGRPFFTMELVEGQGLDELGELPPARVKALLVPLLQALGYVHHLGFVHRDLKAANVRLMADGTLKLMDFGLMDFAGRAGASISGTPAYMAPEVIKRGPIDQRSDLYALGVLAYEMLTGRLPFEGDASGSGAGIAKLLRAHLSEAPVPPSQHRPGLEPALEAVVLRLLQKEPGERFSSAAEVLLALGHAGSGERDSHLLSAPLTGRDVEMQGLTAPLAALAKGQPVAAVALVGEAGIGKSHLLEEFRVAVQLAELGFGLGRASDQGGTPYEPISLLLRSLLPALRARVPEALALAAPVLVKLLPELGATPALDLDPPSKERTRLQAVIVELVATLAVRQPTVLVLEDWHWADPVSCELLGGLVRASLGVPLWLVLSSRPQAGVGTLGAVTPWALAPLDAPALARMVQAMLGTTQVDAGFVAAIATFSSGNPFTARELLDNLVEEGLLVNARGGWNTATALLGERPPRNLRALLLRKLSYLSLEAQRLAAIAAIAGRSTDLALLNATAELPDEAFFAALERLRAHLILVEDGEGRYRFTQDQLQELILQQLPAVERTRLHLACARVVEARLEGRSPAEAPLELVLAIAHHLLEGGATEQLVPYALEAGRRSYCLFANAEAERLLKAGLAIVSADGARYPHERFDYLRAWGDVARALGDTTEAEKTLLAALALAPEVGEADAQGDLFTSLAKCCQLRGDLDAAERWCARSREVCEARPDQAGLARSLLTSSRLHYFQGHFAEALADTQHALEVAVGQADTHREAEATAFLGFLNTVAGPAERERGIAQLLEAEAMLVRLGDRVGLQNALNLLGNTRLAEGDFRAASETFTLSRKLAYESGLRDDEMVCDLNLAICNLELGDYRDAVGRASRAAALAQGLKNQFIGALATIVEATARVYLGEFAGAVALTEQALGVALATGNKYMETLIIQYQVEMYANLGLWSEAQAAALGLLTLLKETGNNEPEAGICAFLAELLARRGDRPGADGYMLQADQHAAATGAKAVAVRTGKVRAWLALQAGEWGEARHHALAALALARVLGTRYMAAELEGMLGEVALATRSPDALQRFEAMAADAAAMGSELLEAQALFGQAACQPERAGVLGARARTLFDKLLLGLEAPARAAFSAPRERQRILEGDPVAGFRSRSQTRPLPGLRPGQGGFGLL